MIADPAAPRKIVALMFWALGLACAIALHRKAALDSGYYYFSIVAIWGFIWLREVLHD